MSEHLPPRFAEVERELDRIARRLLTEQREGDGAETPREQIEAALSISGDEET